MPYIVIILTVPLAIYACLKWWFDTDIVDHIINVFSIGKVRNLVEFKEYLSQKGRLSILLIELFECPWCLSFHFSVWLNLIVQFPFGFYGVGPTLLSVIASAGGGIFLWQNDLKG